MQQQNQMGNGRYTMMEAQPLAQPHNADGILQVDLVNQRVHHPVGLQLRGRGIAGAVKVVALEIVSYHAGCDVACLWGNAPATYSFGVELQSYTAQKGP